LPTVVTERLDSPRILAGTRGELRLTVYQDGTAVDISNSPAPSVVLTNADTGATITPATGVVEEATGKLVQVLSGSETSTPQRIKAVWSLSASETDDIPMTFTTYHEIVGDLLFSIPEARAFDKGELANETTFAQADILAMRDQIWEAFEDICGVAFGTRATREIVNGDGQSAIWLSYPQVQAVSAISSRSVSTWTAFTADELAAVSVYPNGKLYRESGGYWPDGARNLRIDYTHGWARVPLEIRDAALIVLRDRLPGSNLTNRALSQTNEMGTFRISAPGERGKWFGIPAVDERLARYRRTLPGIA
jgi:hypothetical protein